MDLSQLRLLVAIADLGGFSQAAKALHMSQPTISIQIRQLEHRLGVQLCERRGRNGTVLTPAGKIVYHHSRELLQRMEAMQAAVEKLKSGTPGDLTVSATYTSYIYILPEVLREFRRYFSELRLFTTTALVPEILESVRRRRVDLGIVWGPVSDDFKAYHLTEEPFLIVARPDHPLAQKDQVTPDDLSNCTLIQYSPGASTRVFVEERFHRAGIRVQNAIEFETPPACKEGILAGMGVGVLSQTATAHEVAEGLLQVLTVPGLKMERPLLLVHRHDTELSPQAESFRDFVIAQMHASPQPVGSPT